MRTRFIYFIIFQIIAWSFYFNWDYNTRNEGQTSRKILRVAEISPSYVSHVIPDSQAYSLVLRNDGFFTRLNADQTWESGLWKIDYKEHAIVLIGPQGEHHYRILDEGNDRIQVSLVGSDELAGKMDVKDRDLLFSSTSLN